jgi:carbamoyltransferase
LKVLGLHTMFHDSGASAIVDGEISSISEARLSRVKHTGAFPYRSIRYIMNMHGIADINDFDVLAVDHLFRNKKGITEQHIRETGYKGEIWFIGHHDAHAASAFFCSPFREAAVLIVDGQGSSAYEDSYDREALTEQSGDDAHELQSYYMGNGNRLKLISRTMSSDARRHGIGDFYSAITQYLNFGVEHGKVMGLAPYGGNSNWSKKIFIEHHNNGDFFLNTPGWAYESADVARLCFDSHAPRANEPVRDPFWADVAYVAQNNCEYAVVEMAKHLYDITRCKNICLAGGVALNALSNQKILDETPFENIFVQPAASDEGISLGVALYAYHQLMGEERFYEMRHAFLGKTYSDDCIKAVLRDKKEFIHVRRSEEVCKEAAAAVADQKIVGWFQGASEFGPRALGHRSILCDPRPAGMRDHLNARVKFRESFQPFAPSVLAEHYADYFHLHCESPFMLLIARVKEEMRAGLQAVTHVDGTARVQTIRSSENPCYYKLINAFKEHTGVPVVLNTSFNVAGEPIVESPADALNCFLGTGIDVLVMHDYIITKRQ